VAVLFCDTQVSRRAIYMGGVLLVTFLSRQEKQLAIGRNQSKPYIKNYELAPGHYLLLRNSRYQPWDDELQA
jgi:hypothetical protein